MATKYPDMSKYAVDPMANLAISIGSDIIKSIASREREEAKMLYEQSKLKDSRSYTEKQDALKRKQGITDELGKYEAKKMIDQQYGKSGLSDKMLETLMENARTPCAEGDAACESLRLQSLEKLEQYGYLKSGFGAQKKAPISNTGGILNDAVTAAKYATGYQEDTATPEQRSMTNSSTGHSMERVPFVPQQSKSNALLEEAQGTSVFDRYK